MTLALLIYFGFSFTAVVGVTWITLAYRSKGAAVAAGLATLIFFALVAWALYRWVLPELQAISVQ